MRARGAFLHSSGQRLLLLAVAGTACLAAPSLASAGAAIVKNADYEWCNNHSCRHFFEVQVSPNAREVYLNYDAPPLATRGCTTGALVAMGGGDIVRIKNGGFKERLRLAAGTPAHSAVPVVTGRFASGKGVSLSLSTPGRAAGAKRCTAHVTLNARFHDIEPPPSPGA